MGIIVANKKSNICLYIKCFSIMDHFLILLIYNTYKHMFLNTTEEIFKNLNVFFIVDISKLLYFLIYFGTYYHVLY